MAAAYGKGGTICPPLFGAAPRRTTCNICAHTGAAARNIGADKWFEKAADQGDILAQNGLGFAFDHGRGVPQSHERAYELYKRSAAQGYSDAQNNIGLCYQKGEGCKQSFEQAAKWFEKGAREGHEECKVNLLRLAFQVSETDYQQALAILESCASLGNAAAQFFVAFVAFRDRSIDECLRHLDLASAQGFRPATALFSLADWVISDKVNEFLTVRGALVAVVAVVAVMAVGGWWRLALAAALVPVACLVIGLAFVAWTLFEADLLRLW